MQRQPPPGRAVQGEGVRIRSVHVGGGQAKVQPPPPQPPCAACLSTLAASQDVIVAYTRLLGNVRDQFIQDVVKHAGEEDVWVRALRGLGVPEASYYARK